MPDGFRYEWRVRHRCSAGEPCTEALDLWRDGVALRVVFRGGDGRVVSGGAYTHSGRVSDEHGHSVNLHEPGVVRAFVDEVRRRGGEAGDVDGREPAAGEVDGWELLPAVAVSRAAATPEVPPDCPPGP